MLLIQSCCNMISIGVTRCLRLSNFTGSPNRRHGPPVIFSYSLMCIWDAKLPLGGCQSASSKVTRWTRHGEKGWEMRERERERCFVITSPDKWTRDSLIPPPSPQLRIIGDPSNRLTSRIFRSRTFLIQIANVLKCWVNSKKFREHLVCLRMDI